MRRVLLAVLAANCAVAAAKVVYGRISGSIAVEADGLHSSLDALNNIAGLAVLGQAARPPDAGHPYGHRRFEVLATMAIGLLMLLVAVRTAREAWEALRGGSPPDLGFEALVVVVATFAVNVAVAGLEARAGRRLGSAFLRADASHTLTDVFVTMGVAAGVVGARAGVRGADAVAGLLVSGIIAVLGARIVSAAAAGLVDAAALPERELRAEVEAVAGVRRCARVRSRRSASRVLVDVVVEVDPTLTVRGGHDVADAVELAIRRRWPDVADVLVHVEPMHSG